MILSLAVEQYILHKRSLGIGFRSEAVRLRLHTYGWILFYMGYFVIMR